MTAAAADLAGPDSPAAPRSPAGNRAGDPCPNQCLTRYGRWAIPATMQLTGGPGTPELWCPACHEYFGRE